MVHDLVQSETEHSTYADTDAHQWLCPALWESGEQLPPLSVLTLAPGRRIVSQDFLYPREACFSDDQILRLLSALWSRTSAASWRLAAEARLLPFSLPPDARALAGEDGLIVLDGAENPGELEAVRESLPFCHQWRIALYGKARATEQRATRTRWATGDDGRGSWLPTEMRRGGYQLVALVEQPDPLGGPTVVAQQGCDADDLAHAVSAALMEPVFVGSYGVDAVYEVLDIPSAGLDLTGPRGTTGASGPVADG